MRDRRIPAAALPLLLACAAAAACREAPPPAGDARAFSPAARRLEIVPDESGPPDAVIGHVIAARVTEGGRHVAVLDFAPPYVKVFDSRGRFVRAFLRAGGGPGEALNPVALAASGDTALFVADAAGRLMVFGMDGRLRHQAAVPRMRVLAATAGCAGDWVVYGPRYGSNAQHPTWLHRVRVGTGEGMVSADLLPDSLASDMLPMGVAYGLVSDGRRAVAWHTLGAAPVLATWGCGDAAARLAAHDLPGREKRATVERRGDRTQMTIAPGTRSRGGMAAVAGGVVIAEMVVERVGRPPITELTLLRDDGTRRTVTAPGEFVIRDSRPGVGVLLSSTDPVPHLFLVSQADLLALFAPRP
ncbi:MAG TPA: hypothetical protein VM890_04110 [Longimicrobium sp.]|nr:hypothetical protein [Longimicrobium sp.]